VQDAVLVQQGEHLPHGLHAVVEHVVVRQRDDVDAGGLQARDVLSVRAEVEPLAGPGLAVVGEHALEVREPQVRLREQGEDVPPRMGRALVAQPLVDQPAEHDIADECDPHEPPPVRTLPS
jgi:hypothetical protein